MLICSLYYINPDKLLKDHKPIPYSDPLFQEAVWVKNMTRIMHATLILSNCIRVYINCKENRLIIKLLRVGEIFLFMYSIMYQQYYIILNPPEKGVAPYYYTMKFWMIIEITMFYTLIFTAALFLFFVQIRGLLGYKSEVLN